MHVEDAKIRLLSREYLVLDVDPDAVNELDLGCGSGRSWISSR